MIAQSTERPEDITIGTTLVIIRDGFQQVEVPAGEEGQTETVWQWDEIRLPPVEFEALQKGQWRGPWTENSHKAFRQYQHDRTLGLYDLARRKAKANPVWETYISQLDAWNEQVSALAATMSTAIPDLPIQP